MVSCGGTSAQLKAQAAADFHCPEEQIEKDAVQQYVEHVSGCNKENVYAFDHATKTWVSPVDRATFDLDCPKDQLTPRQIDSRSVGVTGCGKKSVYVLSQTLVPKPPWGMILQNNWVANGISAQSTPAGSGAPPPPVAAPPGE